MLGVSHLAAPLELRVPRGEQRVVELGELLIETELTLREVLPHAHQLALEMPKSHTEQVKQTKMLSLFFSFVII